MCAIKDEQKPSDPLHLNSLSLEVVAAFTSVLGARARVGGVIAVLIDSDIQRRVIDGDLHDSCMVSLDCDRPVVRGILVLPLVRWGLLQPIHWRGDLENRLDLQVRLM